jgi:peroxiredoxin Q/BCP
LTLKNEKDEDVDVSTLAAEKGVVFFLVPKADTRELNKSSSGKSACLLTTIDAAGCTNQACGFRDIYPDFTSVNYEVYCLSADTPAAQSKWQTKVSRGLPSDETFY